MSCTFDLWWQLYSSCLKLPHVAAVIRPREVPPASNLTVGTGRCGFHEPLRSRILSNGARGCYNSRHCEGLLGILVVRQIHHTDVLGICSIPEHPLRPHPGDPHSQRTDHLVCILTLNHTGDAFDVAQAHCLVCKTQAVQDVDREF